MENNKFTVITNRYLAESLAFMGFRYMKFKDDENGKIVFSFKNTNKFNLALHKILIVRDEIRAIE